MRFFPVLLAVLILAGPPASAAEEPPSIAELAARLSSEDLGVRQHAAWDLWRRRAEAAPAAAALAAALRDEDPYVRNTSARAVQGLLVGAPEAVPELVKGLADGRVEVRRLTSRLLAWCYGHVTAARKPLMDALAGDEDAEVRANAANSLRLLPKGEAGPAIPALLEATKDPDEGVRVQVMTALGWLERMTGVEPEEVPPIRSVAIRLLKDPSPRVRESSLHWLATTPDLPPSLADEAVALTHDDDAPVRGRAAFLLGSFPDRLDLVVPALLHSIRDDALWVRIESAVSLSRLAPRDVRVAAALGDALGERVHNLTLAAAGGLAKMGPFAAGQAPALAQALRETDRYDERMALADALGAVLGPLLKEAVPALDADTGRDPDYATIHSAAALLRLRRRDPASLRLLVDALADERLGSYAARLLSDLGSLAVPALDDIEKMTKGDGVPALRADYVLARLSPIAADAALARLCAVLDAPDDPRRIEAARLLAGLGPAAAPAVPDLIRALEGGDRDLSTAAANTLGAIGAAAESALPALETAAKEEDVRRPFPGGVMFRQAIRQIRESLAAEGASGPR